MIFDHLKENWTNHIAAFGGTAFSIFNGVAIAQSVVVGVLIFLITNGLKLLHNKIFPKCK